MDFLTDIPYRIHLPIDVIHFSDNIRITNRSNWRTLALHRDGRRLGCETGRSQGPKKEEEDYNQRSKSPIRE